MSKTMVKRIRVLGRGTLAAGASALLAIPVVAQQAPTSRPPLVLPSVGLGQTSPAARPSPGPTPIPVPTPVAPPLPLPVLSADQATQLQDILRTGAIANGLRHEDAPGMTSAPDNDTLVRAALDYARAVHAGRLATDDFDVNWGLRPAAYDPLPGFIDAVKTSRLAAWDASLPPPYEGYDNLKKGLTIYRALEAAGGWAKIDSGPDLAIGSTGPRVVALRARLQVEDNQVAATGDSFDEPLKQAVIRAQKRYGLNPTGTVSSGTLAALNVPAPERVRQIMANMERWRWLPAQLPVNRIQVNIAAAVLSVFQGDAPIMSMRAVTGKPGHETPMLSSRISSIVLNPPWNVPSDIAAKEILPKGPAYLAKHAFKVIRNPDGSTRLQQQSSQSALGHYKFDFANSYAVYLHDTPSHATFSTYARLESHGCVRLEKPAELANLLLHGDATWTPDAVSAAVAKGDTIRVPVADGPSVFLLYWTAYASGTGVMNFRGDPYGWDKSLASKIEHRSAVTQLAAR